MTFIPMSPMQTFGANPMAQSKSSQIPYMIGADMSQKEIGGRGGACKSTCIVIVIIYVYIYAYIYIYVHMLSMNRNLITTMPILPGRIAGASLSVPGTFVMLCFTKTSSRKNS